MTTAQLKKILTEELDYCESFLCEKTRKNPTYQKLLDMPIEELPKHINDESPYDEMARARLKGEDINTPLWHCRALNDVEFTYEDYRHIGMNDGVLSFIWKIANKLHDKKMCQRAMTAQYSDD